MKEFTRSSWGCQPALPLFDPTFGLVTSSAAMLSLLERPLSVLGEIGILTKDAVVQAFKRPFGVGLVLDEMYNLGVTSLSISNVTLLFTGMVICIQTSYTLGAYGAKIYVGNMVGLSIALELGPVLTALMVAGRVGAGITADLGTMTVTEQVDALRALAANPVKHLVVPRTLALQIGRASCRERGECTEGAGRG